MLGVAARVLVGDAVGEARQEHHRRERPPGRGCRRSRHGVEPHPQRREAHDERDDATASRGDAHRSRTAGSENAPRCASPSAAQASSATISTRPADQHSERCSSGRVRDGTGRPTVPSTGSGTAPRSVLSAAAAPRLMVCQPSGAPPGRGFGRRVSASHWISENRPRSAARRRDPPPPAAARSEGNGEEFRQPAPR